MAEQLGDALLSLRTDDSQFAAGVGKAEKQAERLGTTLDRTSDKAQATGTALTKTGQQAATMGGQFDRAGAVVTKSAGAQRAGMQQLSMQLNDVATMYALGAKPMQIFASQGGQVIQAMQLMSAGGGRLVGFLAGPWGMAITTATIVLVPLISNLMQTEQAMEKVEFASNAMADAQGILGNVMDLTTGKINTQSAALLALARAQAIAGKVQAQARAAQARSQVQGLQDKRFTDKSSMMGLNFSFEKGIESQVSSQLLNGAITGEQAVKKLELLRSRGRITDKQFLDAASAISNLGVETENIKVYEQLEKALDGDKGAIGEFLTPGSKRKGKPKAKGADAAKIESRFNDELAGLTDRTLNAMERQATNAEDEAEYRLRGVELARRRTLEDIKASADYSAVQKQRLAQQVDELAEWERKGIELDKQARIEREQSALAQDRHQAAVEDLRLQADMAGTQAERKQLALEIFALEERYQRSLLKAIVASETATDAEKQRAELALARLEESAGRRREGVARANETEVERYLRDLDKTDAQIAEAVEGIAIDGLERLNDGLVDAIMNADSLGDAFTAMANQIIADLLRIAIQQAIIRPLAEALFGGSSGMGGGGLGSLFAGFFASGGSIPAGQFGIVGERGPEPVIGTSQGARVLPNSALRGMMGGRSGPDKIEVIVSGARGNAEIEAMVRSGVRSGLKAYDRGVGERAQDQLARRD